MKQEKIDLFYKTLLEGSYALHQKVKQLANQTELTFSDWLEKLDRSDVQRFTDDRLWYITTIANQIAAGFGPGGKGSRQKELLDGVIANKQADLFNVFGNTKTLRYFSAKELNAKGKPNYASEAPQTATVEELTVLLEKLEHSLSELAFNQGNTDSALTLLESLLSYVPTSTELSELSDISLFDYTKLSAGFAQAIYDFLLSQNRQNFKNELKEKEKQFYQEEAFLLASFDLSGIQDFIYNIVSKGAAKQLRARSFYLDMMSEHIADSLLETLDLSRANLLYLGGGHAYFLFANTAETITKLEKFENRFNEFLLEHFKTRLYVAFAWSSFSANTIVSSESSLQNYRSLYQSLSRKISSKKLSRYNHDILRTLNEAGKGDGRECQICHAVDNLQEVGDQILCQMCAKLQVFSNAIDNSQYMISSDFDGLPIGPNAYLSAIPQKQYKGSRVYVKNDYQTRQAHSTHIFVGDYRAEKDLTHYARLSVTESSQSNKRQGIKRLSVVRLDVDDLGAGFMAGFSYQENGKYSSFVRSAMFSRSMSQFFKVYINTIAKGKNISIIYAGGDDVFAIGTWQDIIAFTVELRQQFRRWTNSKLSLSAGIGLYSEKTPVHLMARHSGDLEEAAKANEKDSIALFSDHLVFKFDDFIEAIYQDKLPIIRAFFATQDERGQAFIYKLLELLRSDEKISIARTAYYLASLEDRTKDDDKPVFSRFKSRYFKWVTADAEVRKQVECALILYIYETRKES